jgi:hypothetical protein
MSEALKPDYLTRDVAAYRERMATEETRLRDEHNLLLSMVEDILALRGFRGPAEALARPKPGMGSWPDDIIGVWRFGREDIGAKISTSGTVSLYRLIRGGNGGHQTAGAANTYEEWVALLARDPRFPSAGSAPEADRG